MVTCEECGNDTVAQGQEQCLDCLEKLSHKAVYVIGAAATGKSSVMRVLLDILGLGTGEWYKIFPTTHAEFRGEPLEDIVTGAYKGLSLGVTRPGGFSGTDAIGMASHSEAMAWLESGSELPPLILGEGQRLGTARFLTALAERTDLTVCYLTAERWVLDNRCEERGSNQKESFRKSTATGSANSAAALLAAGVRVMQFDSGKMGSKEIAENLTKFL
jgi:hypothetical protein